MAEVKTIIENYKKGLRNDFDCMIAAISHPQVSSAELIRYLSGLRECVSLQNKEFELLIKHIMKLDWTVKEDAVIQEFRAYVLDLVSAHDALYLRLCLLALARQFFPRPADMPKEYDKNHSKSVGEKCRQIHNRSFTNVHLVLQNICKLIPRATSVLVDVLEESFPYHTRCVFTHDCYVTNLLSISEYLMSERLRLLHLIVDKMVQIDVRCAREIINESEESQELEREDEVMDMGDNVTENHSESPAMQNKDANKLDVLMEIMLTYIHNTCYNKEELNWEATKKLYRELLFVFEKVLFRTHASCHIQFIMFYLCSFRPELCDGFLDYLWSYVTNPNSESVHRQTAVSYIASLIARAKFISVKTVNDLLELLCHWLHEYIDQSAYSSQPDLWRHGPFYSVAQAVFYMIAFRHKEILDSKKGYKHLKKLGLQTIIASRLNPLQFCLPIVVRTFASITRMHQIALCDHIIERNSRSMLPVAKDHNSYLHATTLDAFFPFDPYILTKSAKFITPLYREFEGSIVDDESDDLEDEDEFLEETSEPEAQVDLLQYSTSPGFKHV